MSGAFARITRFDGGDPTAAYCEATTGIPRSVPPVRVISPNERCPRGFVINVNDRAVVDDMMNTRPSAPEFGVINGANNACRSARIAASPEPDDGIGVTPLVIDA